MTQPLIFPKRTVHLDFHTGPDIPDVGRDFDPDEFARTFAEARVDSVTVFAKCHHGHLYYGTDRPERHPGLARDLDLLRAQVDALHGRGIRAPIYLSVQVDEWAARHHPEWVARDERGALVKAGGPFQASWHTLDMATPYQDFLADQFAEVLDRFAPADGVFLDMCWDQPSTTGPFLDGMRRRGYDPASEDDRRRHAREVAHGYMARFRDMLEQAQRGHAPAGIWFNSRPKTNLHVEKKFLRHIEVECLPTGGWGYAYFPYVARFVRPFGLPTLSHTGRFHTSWGDFGGIKPEAALRYECASILSQGMTNGVGDQMHPRGVLDPAAYRLIGDVYRHIEACEPYVEGGRPLSDIAVLVDPARGDQPGADGLGLIRALQQLRQQFDLLPPGASLAGYPLVIVPESAPVDAATRQAFRDHLQRGGALLIAGQAALDQSGRPVLPELGIEAHGPSPYTATYLRPAPALAAGLPPTDHVLYERGFRMTAAGGAEVLCGVVEPYFERAWDRFCSHAQTPPDRPSPYAALVQSGRAITASFPLFTAYGQSGNLPYRELLRRCLDRLLPDPLLRDGGPSYLEATVVQGGARTAVHLLSFLPSRRTPTLDLIEDALPLVDMPLSVRLPQTPRRAFLAPAGADLSVTYAQGRAEVRVSVAGGHALVVFE